MAWFELYLKITFVAEVFQELSTTLDVLKKSVNTPREFHLLCHCPLLYVFKKEEMTANSSVSVSVWDKLAQISLETLSLQETVTLPDPTILSIDFRPLLMDNVALREEGLASPEFDNVFTGKTPSVDCREYTYENEQCGINWEHPGKIVSLWLFLLLVKIELD